MSYYQHDPMSIWEDREAYMRAYEAQQKRIRQEQFGEEWNRDLRWFREEAERKAENRIKRAASAERRDLKKLKKGLAHIWGQA